MNILDAMEQAIIHQDHTVIGFAYWDGETWNYSSSNIYYKDYARFDDLPDVAKNEAVKARYEEFWRNKKAASSRPHQLAPTAGGGA